MKYAAQRGQIHMVLLSKEDITRITVGGFKSIGQEQSIEIKPLTILAGANSSGKSSIMQPLLLLKQTLDATYDPGPLLLNGPNVKFTRADQFFSRVGEHRDKLVVGFCFGYEQTILSFRRSEHRVALDGSVYPESGTTEPFR